MLVKAKCNVSDRFGLHRVGDIWDTDEDLGELAEVLDEPKGEKPASKAEPKEESKAEAPVARTRSTTRKRTSK